MSRDGEEDGNSIEHKWAQLRKVNPLDLEEDIFAMAISDLSSDLMFLENDDTHRSVHVSRITTVLFLLLFTLFTQIFLMANIKKFVTAKSVHDIRIHYDEYEVAMYGNDTSRMDLTANLKHRGRPQFFNASLFDALPEREKAQACCIPLSQPYFFGCVLIIWTTVCLSELQKTAKRTTALIIRTNTCDSMADCFTRVEGLDSFEEDERMGKRVIYQLTMRVKVLFFLIIFLPRLVINCVLLWLGCRWLLATTDFSDLILNAVALQFVLDLGQIFYYAAVPERNKHDLSLTKMMPLDLWHFEVGHKQGVQVFVFFSLAFGWVYLYMTRFQMVLPQYKWDVHAVCKHWIKIRFAV